MKPDYRQKPSMYLSQNSEESGNRKSSFIILIKADLHNLKLLSGFEICVQAAGYNGAHTVGLKHIHSMAIWFVEFSSEEDTKSERCFS